jgi:hypothetical protein
VTDILIYWRDYKENWIRQFAGDREHLWHSNARLLGNLQSGDHLWMVTSGKSIRHDAEQSGFLVAVWQVKEVVHNPDDDPAYPSEEYRYRLVADPDQSISFSDPVSVDHILRPMGRDQAISIGRFLQGPRKLDQQKLRLLKAAAGPDLAIQWLTGNKP